MLLTPEYKEMCKNQILANMKTKPFVIGPRHYQERVKQIINFIDKIRDIKTKILDVGCGAFLPTEIKATHAIDVHPVAGELLRKQGWTGKFRTGSCTDIPFRHKAFDIAICTEVIEHLPTVKDVKDTFKELDRVAFNWLVTTPRASKSGFRDEWNTESDHKQFFTKDDLWDILVPILKRHKIKFRDVEHYVFIEKTRTGL